MDSNVSSNQPPITQEREYEVIKLEKTKKVCGLCEEYSSSKSEEPELIAVLSCEGACLRGEVSRRVANKICFEELKGISARVCLGGAFTKDTGQRNMVRSAKKVIALEGCYIECASRMMRAVIPDLKPEIIFVDKYYEFDKKLFALNDVSENELAIFSEQATKKIINLIHE